MAERVHLIIENGPRKGEHVQVPPGSLLVGRGSNCDLQFEDPQQSRQHCRFFFVSGRLRVADLASINHTYVNDEPVSDCFLSTGDRITIGDTRLVVLDCFSGDFERTPSDAAPRPKRPSPGRLAAAIGRPIAFVAWCAMAAWLAFLAYCLILPPPSGEPAAPERPAPAQAPARAEPKPAAAGDSTAQPKPPRAGAKPAPAATAPASDLPVFEEQALAEMKTTIASAFLAENFAAAQAAVKQFSPDVSRGLRLQLDSLAQYVEDVSSLPDRITSRIAEHLGEPMELHNGTRRVRLTPYAIAGDRVEATVDRAGKTENLSFQISKLTAIERSRLLGDAATQPEHAMKCILNFRGKDIAGALTEAAEAGPLADALREAILAAKPTP